MPNRPHDAADVLVIGGGIAGAATAAFLAEGGASVVLVEGAAIASGASGRNSGVVQAPLDPVLASLYRDTLVEYRRLGETGAGFALPAEPAGLLHVTHSAAVARELTAALAATHPELRPELLDPEALVRLEPTLDPALSACRVAIGYPVAPAAATRAYAALAERHGVRIAVGFRGELVREGDTVIGARTGDGRMLAGAVVVAAGPWTPGIVDPTGRWCPIRPVWGVVAEVALTSPPRHVLEEAEIDGTIEPASGGGPSPEASDGFAFSLVTAEGRTVLGSTFLEAEPDPDALMPAIRRRGARFVPALADAPLVATRRCARPQSADGRPLVGRVPWLDGLYVVAGHGPWGISTAPGTARLVADLVLGRRAGVVPPALDPARFGGP